MSVTDIFTFKYEPTTLDEMILHPDIEPILQKSITEIPNLMLIGPPGVGKGTFTNIFLKETGLDYMKINCSDETGIDNLRTKVKSFATALGITKLKIVVMNESDGLSLQGQAMLRDLMEQVQSITRFVFQCNYGHKMIKELLSRCQVIELNNPPGKKIYEHCMSILEREKIDVPKKDVVVNIIRRLYPDIRRIINTLQMSVNNGVLDVAKFESSTDVYGSVLQAMKSSDIDGIRKLLKSNIINYPELYQYLFDEVGEFKSPGDMIIDIGEALYRDSIIAIKEINFMAFTLKGLKEGHI